MLRYDQLRTAVAVAEQRFKLLKDKYPEMRAYLVYCRFGPGSGQCDLTLSVSKMLESFPKMIDSLPVTRDVLEAALKDGNQAVAEKVQAGTTFCSDVLIELRFGILSYKLIDQLQEDELVDRNRTHKGTIRVILGSLDELAEADL